MFRYGHVAAVSTIVVRHVARSRIIVPAAKAAGEQPALGRKKQGERSAEDELEERNGFHFVDLGGDDQDIYVR